PRERLRPPQRARTRPARRSARRGRTGSCGRSGRGRRGPSSRRTLRVAGREIAPARARGPARQGRGRRGAGSRSSARDPAGSPSCPSSSARYRCAPMTLAAEGPLWRAVDGLLARADVDGVLAHRVAPLAAYRLRQLGEPVPAALQPYEQLARMATLTAIPLLRRLRDLADGPLVLVKGAEVASLYPGRAR